MACGAFFQSSVEGSPFLRSADQVIGLQFENHSAVLVTKTDLGLVNFMRDETR